MNSCRRLHRKPISPGCHSAACNTAYGSSFQTNASSSNYIDLAAMQFTASLPMSNTALVLSICRINLHSEGAR